MLFYYNDVNYKQYICILIDRNNPIRSVLYHTSHEAAVIVSGQVAAAWFLGDICKELTVTLCFQPARNASRISKNNF